MNPFFPFLKANFIWIVHTISINASLFIVDKAVVIYSKSFYTNVQTVYVR